MAADTIPLRHLSDLPPADRRQTEASILTLLNKPQNLGWLDWELPELRQAAARSHGVLLTGDEIANLG
jgi:hypothetical protein